jgi:hypothetical protein
MAEMEAENRSEIEIKLQSIPDPIQAKPKKAFVDAISAINQASYPLLW